MYFSMKRLCLEADRMESGHGTIEANGVWVLDYKSKWNRVLVYTRLLISILLLYRLMFWSDWSDDRPLIMRAGLDGTYKTQLVSMDINTPNGVALDYEKQIVYWVDGNLNILEMINYDGT